MDADIDRILFTVSEIAARVLELAFEISADFKHHSGLVFVGVATGAFIFLADLVRQIGLPVAVDFVRVESYGFGTESSGQPSISSDLKVDVNGKHVIVETLATLGAAGRSDATSLPGQFDVCRYSSLRVRDTTSEETSSIQTDELFSDLKEKWDAIENKSTVFLYGGGAIVAIRLSSILVGAINSVPLV